MSLKVTIDKVKEALKSIAKLGTHNVYVGIPSEKNGRDDGATNAMIGFINENGSPAQNIPARPFLIPGVKSVQKEIAQILGDSAKSALDGGNVMAGLTKAGIVGSSSVKKTLQAGDGFAPLAASTIKQRQAKGAKGTKPLIRTGQLRNSIAFVVKAK